MSYYGHPFGQDEAPAPEKDSLVDLIASFFKRADQVVNVAKPAIAATLQVLEDPYLPEVACQVIRLSKLEAGEHPGPGCRRTDPAYASSGRGVGLRHAVLPLRLYMGARQHPVIAALVGASAVGGIFYLGYLAGRS